MNAGTLVNAFGRRVDSFNTRISFNRVTALLVPWVAAHRSEEMKRSVTADMRHCGVGQLELLDQISFQCRTYNSVLDDSISSITTLVSRPLIPDMRITVYPLDVLLRLQDREPQGWLATRRTFMGSSMDTERLISA